MMMKKIQMMSVMLNPLIKTSQGKIFSIRAVNMDLKRES